MSTLTPRWCGGVMLESIPSASCMPLADPFLRLPAASHTAKTYKIGRHPEGSPDQPFWGEPLNNYLMSSKVISRDHALIHVSLNGLTAFCTDLGSTHGTYLRRGDTETRLTAHRAVTLLSDDILCFGKEVIRNNTTYPASKFRVLILNSERSQSTTAPSPVVLGTNTSASVQRTPVTASNIPSAPASAASSRSSSVAPRTGTTVNPFGPRSSSAAPIARNTSPYTSRYGTKGSPSSASPETVGFKQGSYGLTTKEQLGGDGWSGIKSEAGSGPSWRSAQGDVPVSAPESSSALTNADRPISAEGKLASPSPAIHDPQATQTIARADTTGSAGLETPADMPEPAASASAAEDGVASDTDRETTQVSYAQVVAAGTDSSNDKMKEPEGQKAITCDVSQGESTTPASANDATGPVETTAATASTANGEAASLFDPKTHKEALESPSLVAGRKRSFDEAHDDDETGDHTIVADTTSSAAVTSQPAMTTTVSAPQSRFKRIRISRARARDIAVGMATGAIGTFFSLAFCGARYLE